MRKIYDGMRPGGLLIISEKIQFPDPALNELFLRPRLMPKPRVRWRTL